MKKSFLSLPVARATAIAAVGLLIVACSSSDTDPVANDAKVTEVDVGTNGNSFLPAEVTIKAGEKVRWTFKAGVHNVLSGADCKGDGKFGAGTETEAATGQYEFLFATPGEFEYYCSFHCSMNMKGIVRVTP